ncbi:MAG: murein biosynthesis integral membrane protein MurJ [Rhodospirillales bacterium]|nr:murein biosynthesis integral membrane protein MurJ [Rhodospirillales bacterium]
MSLARPVATVGFYTLASRVLGFVRDMLVAALLGAGPVADAFFVAFKFPNFFRRLFAEGAFAAAFVPMFAGTLAADGPAAARLIAERAQAVLLAALFGLLVVAEFAMPWIVAVIAPGFAHDPARAGLAVEFTRITFPYLLFISLVSLQGGVLNSMDRFAAVAATPVLMNLCMIAGLLAFARTLPTPGHALSWSVLAAGVVQFLFLAWCCARAGMGLRLPRPHLTGEVRTLLRRMLPVAIGSGAAQINLVVDVIMASLLPAGSISWLYYADRIYELPLAVIGIAIGTALLPRLSKQVRTGAQEEARTTQNRALEGAMLLTLPAAAALIVLAGPIVSVLFERGAFTAEDARRCAAALVAYTAGLPAYVAIKVLTPAFYAREDTRTPVTIGLVAVAANTVVGFTAMQFVGHVGLAAATAFAATLNAALLWHALVRRGNFSADARLRARLPRQLAASAAMALALWLVLDPFAPWLAQHGPARYVALALLVTLGLAVYALAALVTQAARPADLRAILARRA